jgi:hypothetical protein
MRAAQAYTRMGTVDKPFPGASETFVSVAAIHTIGTRRQAQHPSSSGGNYAACCTTMLQVFCHPRVNLGGGGGGRNGRESRHRRFVRAQPRGAGQGYVESA